jgi:hypothetical protein
VHLGHRAKHSVKRRDVDSGPFPQERPITASKTIDMEIGLRRTPDCVTVANLKRGSKIELYGGI